MGTSSATTRSVSTTAMCVTARMIAAMEVTRVWSMPAKQSTCHAPKASGNALAHMSLEFVLILIRFVFCFQQPFSRSLLSKRQLSFLLDIIFINKLILSYEIISFFV